MSTSILYGQLGVRYLPYGLYLHQQQTRESEERKGPSRFPPLKGTLKNLRASSQRIPVPFQEKIMVGSNTILN